MAVTEAGDARGVQAVSTAAARVAGDADEEAQLPKHQGACLLQQHRAFPTLNGIGVGTRKRRRLQEGFLYV